MKLPISGKTVATSAGASPNHVASVAAYCSTAHVGIQRPRVSVSSGPPSWSVGKTEPFDPGHAVEVAAATAPPSTNWWLPQP